MSDKPDVKKPPVKIFENQLMAAEYARAEYLFTAPPGYAPEDFLEPEAYAHVAGRKLKPDDVVTVTAEDRSWRCQVLVLAISGQVIHLAMLSKHEFAPIVGKEHEAYEEEWAGPSAKWRVLRKSDRHVMVDKLATKSAAVAWIENRPLAQAA